MQYTKLGRSGLDVSRLCLGTMNLGTHIDQAASFRMLDRALELGINFWDTANIYGEPLGKGVTETIIGNWLAQGGGRRDQIVLATKVYNQMEGGGPNRDQGLSAYKIKREIEESLRRLQTDHVDLYQMHRSDRTGVTWTEIWNAFIDIVAAGKAIYIGSSNHAAYEIALAQGVADRMNFLGIISEQHKYNLAIREPELEVLPGCKRMGVGVIAFSPLASGFLSGKALAPNATDSPRASSKKVQTQVKIRRAQLEAYADFCQKRGWKEAEVAIAWVLRNEAITSPIIGPRTVEQLESMVKAMDLKLGADDLAELDKIFPGPGGPAPFAYFW